MGVCRNSRPQWSPRIKLTVALLLLGLGIFLLYLFRAAIAPLILAVLLAFVLTPLANWIQIRLACSRALAGLVAYLVLLLVLIAIPLVIIPPLTAQSSGLTLNIHQYMSQIEALMGNTYQIAGYTIDVDQAIEQVMGSFQGLIEPVFGGTLRFAIEAISSLIWIVFIVVVSFYLVKDGPKLARWFDKITPPAYQSDMLLLREEINLVWNAFLRGQLTLAFLVSVIFTIACFILGLPFAMVMGILAGLLEFFPSIGHGIWLAAAVMLALFAGSTWLPLPNWAFALLIIGLHIFYQQFDLNYLIPRIVGKRVHLPPLVVILGIVTGALVAGVLGVVLAAPSIATARVLGRYIYANLLDQNPFPETIVKSLPPPNPRWWRFGSQTKTAIDDENLHPL